MTSRRQLSLLGAIALGPPLVFAGIRLAQPGVESGRLTPSVLPSVSIVAAGAIPDPACADTPGCKFFGRCTLSAEVCVVAHAEHCARTPRCQEFGACGVGSKSCEPTEERHCSSSQACRERGHCGLAEGRCAVRSAKDCEASQECRDHGKCALKNGSCAVGGADSCLRSERCKRDGMCRLIENELDASCGVLTHADCAKTELCRDQGRCKVARLNFGANGRCLAVTLVEHQRFPLTAARHGMDGELVLSIDPKLSEERDPEGRGYWPNEADPRVSGALQLKDSAGLVRDELTLFPDVSLDVEDLGMGMDSYLATERLACAAGHWCGWTTRFYEVRGGRLALMRALSASGEQREIVVASAGGERWKLQPGKTPGSRELVDQVEGVVPPGPALVETRFRFLPSGARFSEKKWADYDPKIRKQAGRWFGALEFHGFP